MLRRALTVAAALVALPLLAGTVSAAEVKSIAILTPEQGTDYGWNQQFAAGAKSIKPDIKLIYSVIGPAAYGDAAGAKRVTQSVIAAGADIIFGQGDGASFGMIEAVETNKATDGGKVWFIDVIGDKSSIDKGHLLSSVLWNFEPVFGRMVEELKAGIFGKTGYTVSLADGSIALLKTKAIPDAVWADLMKSRDDIIAGKIKVAQVLDAQQVQALMSDVTIGKQ